jgi:hypothetical protein
MNFWRRDLRERRDRRAGSFPRSACRIGVITPTVIHDDHDGHDDHEA